MKRKFLETDQKALEINLDGGIYGSFAEIGAGQEVARHFFKAGAAAGTIAKTISAYDKTVSDEVYGAEQTGRYVCESRLYKMLDHEYELMLDRLGDERPKTCLFAFADTITTINYHKTNYGQGWVGMRFQLTPQSRPSEIVVHVEMADNNTSLQQQAIGILGVNMVYACYRYHDDYRLLLGSLVDHIADRVYVDMVRLDGPNFQHINQRLLPMELVRQGLTQVSIFDKKGRPVHASEFLYKKNVLVVRGSYRPATLVSLDILQSASLQFKTEAEGRTQVMTEITLEDLQQDTGDVDKQDYLDRTNLLNHLGQMVMITNCPKYRHLIRYLKTYRVDKLGLVIGVRPLLNLINSIYYNTRDGNLLSAYGELFTKGVQMYVYPAQKEGSGELMNCENLPVPKEIKHLYQHILNHHHLVDIKGYIEKHLHIYSPEVLRMVKADEEGWDKRVSAKVAKYIRDNGLFGYPCDSVEFDY